MNVGSSACPRALTTESIATKAEEKEALSRDISRILRMMVGRIAVVILASSRGSTPTAGHDLWGPFHHHGASQFHSPDRPP